MATDNSFPLNDRDLQNEIQEKEIQVIKESLISRSRGCEWQRVEDVIEDPAEIAAAWRRWARSLGIVLIGTLIGWLIAKGVFR